MIKYAYQLHQHKKPYLMKAVKPAKRLFSRIAFTRNTFSIKGFSEKVNKVNAERMDRKNRIDSGSKTAIEFIHNQLKRM